MEILAEAVKLFIGRQEIRLFVKCYGLFFTRILLFLMEKISLSISSILLIPLHGLTEKMARKRAGRLAVDQQRDDNMAQAFIIERLERCAVLYVRHC